MATIYLIDGNSYIHRSYHAIRNLVTSKGEPVNAVYGFTRMLVKLIESRKPDYIAVCMDYPATTLRHREYPEYKANRKKTDDELKSQFPIVKEIVKAFNIPIYEMDGYEADDIIAAIAKKAETIGMNVMIMSADKDILQLVNEKTVVYNEQMDKIIGVREVVEKMGILPGNIPDYLALTGDSSDNIPGVNGIGEKTAVKLINEYGSIEKILENSEKINGKIGETIICQRKNALLSKKLATLIKDVPLNVDFDKLKLCSPDSKKLLEIYKKLEFNSLIKKIPNEKSNIEFTVKIISDERTLMSLMVDFKKARNFSLDIFKNKNIIGFSCAISESECFYIPVSHFCLGTVNQLPFEKIAIFFNNLLGDKEMCLICHDIKSMLPVFKKIGIDVKCKLFDIMLAAYLLNPAKKSYDIENVVYEYLGANKKYSIDNTGGDADIETASKVFSENAALILRLKHKMEENLEKSGLSLLFKDVEMPLAFVLSEMEETGILTDRSYFTLLSGEFSKKMEVLEKSIYESAGETFNINSPKQLSKILFEKLGMKPVKKTKTGYSTDEEVLLALSQSHDLPKKLLEYRELSKMKTGFIDSLIEQSDKNTSRVHTTFNQCGTATGRLSSSNPNMQNIPIKTEIGKKIRRGFIPENGFVFLSADYSQIDLRVLAHMSKDSEMNRAFNNGEDIHTSTASKVFNVDIKNVTKQMRDKAKGINFGIIYGQSAFGLSSQIGISPEEAQIYIDEYFKKYSGVKTWIDEIINNAKKNGFVKTMLGRIRYLPEINSSNNQMRSFSERVAMNTPIQGTSSDIIKKAMLSIYEKIKGEKHACRMVLQIHDDLLFEIKKEELEKFSKLVKFEMETAVKLSVPLIVEMRVGANWAEMNRI